MSSGEPFGWSLMRFYISVEILIRFPYLEYGGYWVCFSARVKTIQIKTVYANNTRVSSM
ncbi:hypothetical protein Golax_025927 [Gossypium laxum]|uniref:Uncharacterized protein n=1 Tax=Gossypium laxum TaxID=34288 RepID=A0A7J9B046_9ROSI|nr:hypothetical protein [Gossypium laxum]